DRMASEMPELRQDAVYRTIRADYLLGTGDRAAIWSEVESARTLDPHLAAEHAVSLAALGDLEHAELLARDLPPGTQLRETVSALEQFEKGERDAGLESLRKVSERAPIFSWRVSPLFLLGERLVDAGRDAEAIDVLHRAQALYVPVA